MSIDLMRKFNEALKPKRSIEENVKLLSNPKVFSKEFKLAVCVAAAFGDCKDSGFEIALEKLKHSEKDEDPKKIGKGLMKELESVEEVISDILDSKTVKSEDRLREIEKRLREMLGSGWLMSFPAYLKSRSKILGKEDSLLLDNERTSQEFLQQYCKLFKEDLEKSINHLMKTVADAEVLKKLQDSKQLLEKTAKGERLGPEEKGAIAAMFTFRRMDNFAALARVSDVLKLATRKEATLKDIIKNKKFEPDLGKALTCVANFVAALNRRTAMEDENLTDIQISQEERRFQQLWFLLGAQESPLLDDDLKLIAKLETDIKAKLEADRPEPQMEPLQP